MGLEMEMYTDTRIEEDVWRAWVQKKLERKQFLSSLLHLFNYFWQ